MDPCFQVNQLSHLVKNWIIHKICSLLREDEKQEKNCECDIFSLITHTNYLKANASCMRPTESV